MAKTIFIETLQEGDRIDELFLVKSARLAETRAGKPYLILTVMDKSGELTGPVWDNAERFQELCQPGECIRVKGMVQSYREKLQLKVDEVTPVAKEETDMADFLPATIHSRTEMAAELQKIISTVTNPFIRKLLGRFFKKGEIWDRFQDAPAAKGIHHAYVGGLLEHTLSMARVADMLSGHYEGVDRSLLIAGALLHDLGKIEELYMENGLIDYTARGRLKGHLVIGSEMVGKVAAQIADFPEELLEQLQHLILSHHGRQEYGSPTVPMTVEAFLLNYIDELDSKMNVLEQLRRKLNSTEMSWSDYQRSLERYLYLNALQDEKTEAGRKEEGLTVRQQTLF
ncbi:3'-5' exoribonuclease YhaM family protein [Desulfopila aestuarii]|nr:HD domain-containing protein [Desulfopila aestuarii]